MCCEKDKKRKILHAGGIDAFPFYLFLFLLDTIELIFMLVGIT